MCSAAAQSCVATGQSRQLLPKQVTPAPVDGFQLTGEDLRGLPCAIAYFDSNPVRESCLWIELLLTTRIWYMQLKLLSALPPLSPAKLEAKQWISFWFGRQGNYFQTIPCATFAQPLTDDAPRALQSNSRSNEHWPTTL